MTAGDPLRQLHRVDRQRQGVGRQDRDEVRVGPQPERQLLEAAGQRAVEVDHHQGGLEVAGAEGRQIGVQLDHATGGAQRGGDDLAEALVDRERDHAPSQHRPRSYRTRPRRDQLLAGDPRPTPRSRC
jgi:hypothetical protein